MSSHKTWPNAHDVSAEFIADTSKYVTENMGVTLERPLDITDTPDTIHLHWSDKRKIADLVLHNDTGLFNFVIHNHVDGVKAMDQQGPLGDLVGNTGIMHLLGEWCSIKPSPSAYGPLTMDARDSLYRITTRYDMNVGEFIYLPSKACLDKAEQFLSSPPPPARLQDRVSIALSSDSEAIQLDWHMDNGDVTLCFFEKNGKAEVSYNMAMEGHGRLTAGLVKSVLQFAE